MRSISSRIPASAPIPENASSSSARTRAQTRSTARQEQVPGETHPASSSSARTRMQTRSAATGEQTSGQAQPAPSRSSAASSRNKLKKADEQGRNRISRQLKRKLNSDLPLDVEGITEVLTQHSVLLDKNNKSASYRSLLEFNYHHQHQWPDDLMREIAGVSQVNAARISDVFMARLESPGVKAIQVLIESGELRLDKTKKVESYRKLHDFNQQHNKNWSRIDMQAVADIDPSSAIGVDDAFDAQQSALAPVIQRELEKQRILLSRTNKTENYRKLLAFNQTHNKGWDDKSLRSLAGIDSSRASKIRLKFAAQQGKFSPQGQNIIDEMARSGAPVSNGNAGARYRSVMVFNLTHNKNWQDRHMREVSAIDSGHASDIRKVFTKDQQAVEEIRKQLADKKIAHPADSYMDLLATQQLLDTDWTQEQMLMAAGINTPPDSDPEIKQEEGLMTVRLHEVPLDMSRTAYYPEMGDLTGKQVVWIANLDSQNRTIVRHNMHPDSAMDNVFPLRDPKAPQQPHPDYLPGGLAAVGKVKIGGGFTTYLQKLAAAEKCKGPGACRLNLSAAGMRKMIDVVEQSVREELTRTLHNRPLAKPVVVPRLLEEKDVRPHEKALIGQYGLFLDPDIREGQLPLLSNGKILGLYPGARLETQEELDHSIEMYGEEETERYKMQLSLNDVLLSPLGGSNAIPFANTALDPESPTPEYDDDRINTIFIPFRVKMTTHEGKEKEEEIIAAVAMDNLQDQVFIDYGDEFLVQFAADKSSGIKQEPVD